MKTRREFLVGSTVGPASLLAARFSALLAARLPAAPSRSPRSAPQAADGKAARPLKILFVGGTDFLGPPTVRRAVARGHEVTLFNRGRTNPTLFAELEKIKGDRNVEADLKQLAGREWDAVIDTCGYFPRQVRESAGLLAASVSHYVFVSTISVYRPLGKPGADESAPLEQLPANVDAETTKTIGANYGALKALCEQAAEKEMPGQVTNVRPGLIVGPDDDSDRFTYWPLRVAAGGEVLAPGRPEDPVQFIDVRDLGDFLVRCVEQGSVGTMNATGPKGGLPIGTLLEACRDAAKSSKSGGAPATEATFTFVPDDFLAEQKISGWSDLPVWISPRGEGGGLTAVSVDKAIAAGLTFRGPADTARDTLDWFRSTQGKRALRGGLAREAETKALAAWHAKQAGAAGTKNS
jgi:2'-hydroxyisoflavone reductase